ncbi:MAG: LacI family DNA-binding transcriptional regulator [Planctomycetota bacterium]|jgi:DNA-binding LacI/PurR family transcriptional regulator
MARRREAGKRARFVPVLMPETRELESRWVYYSRMIEALNGGLAEDGIFMRLVPCLHDYQRDHFLQTLGSQYCGAIFLGPMYVYRDFIAEVVEELEGPKVMLDHHFDDLPIHSVREDAVAGMRAVAEHLLGLGHRDIAYLDHADSEANPWKRQGISEALAGAGLPQLGKGRVAGSRHQFADAAAALDWFLEAEEKPTAIMCCDDGHALFLLRAAAERGIEVPADLSVAGYGDFAALTGRSRSLTSAAADPAEIGRRAARLVVESPGPDPVAELITPDLVVRGTTAAPAGGGSGK